MWGGASGRWGQSKGKTEGSVAALPYRQYLCSEEVGDGHTTSEYPQLLSTKVGTQERRLFAWL